MYHDIQYSIRETQCTWGIFQLCVTKIITMYINFTNTAVNLFLFLIFLLILFTFVNYYLCPLLHTGSCGKQIPAMNYLCFLKLWKALSDGKFCLLSLSTLNGTPPKGDLIKLCSETLERGWLISEVQLHCIEWLSAYSHFNITASISSQKYFKINEKTKKSWLEQVYQP